MTASVTCFILGIRSNFRGDSLIKTLRNYGIDVEVHYGIDASKNRTYLATRIDQRASILLQRREMGLTEVACALGHMEIWQRFMEQGEQWALVCEDDAVILENPSILFPALTAIKGAAIMQLNRSIPEDKTIYLNKKIEVTGATVSTRKISLIRKLNFSSGAYGYLINRDAAGIALETSKERKIINILDWPYLWRHKVDFWEPSVDLVGHQGESIIDSDRAAHLASLHQKVSESSAIRIRIRDFLSNLLGIPAWKFHGLGYPGRIVYFNNVIMPFRRRYILLRSLATKRFRSGKPES